MTFEINYNGIVTDISAHEYTDGNAMILGIPKTGSDKGKPIIYGFKDISNPSGKVFLTNMTANDELEQALFTYAFIVGEVELQTIGSFTYRTFLEGETLNPPLP